MIVNLNGHFWYDTDELTDLGESIYFKKSNKLKNFAITLWTSSSFLFAKNIHAESFYESTKPLEYVFQDIALGLGTLFALSGLLLLAFKRRWGTITLKTTGIVVGGVFLVPAGLMFVGIVGTLLNEALTDAFESIRGSENIKDVTGQ